MGFIAEKVTAVQKAVYEECPDCKGASGGCKTCGPKGGPNGYMPHSHDVKKESFSKPGTADVSPSDRKKIAPLARHYLAKPHPFTSCVRDQKKHGLSDDHAKRRCAVLLDTFDPGRKKHSVQKAGEADPYARLAQEERSAELHALAAEQTVPGVQAFSDLGKAATKRGSNPRWPKGTPGIGGQWRPDGMPDSIANFAAKALGSLDARNEVHREIAKDFNNKLKQRNWKDLTPAQAESAIHSDVRELSTTIRSFGHGGPAAARFLADVKARRGKPVPKGNRRTGTKIPFAEPRTVAEAKVRVNTLQEQIEDLRDAREAALPKGAGFKERLAWQDEPEVKALFDEKRELSSRISNTKYGPAGSDFGDQPLGQAWPSDLRRPRIGYSAREDDLLTVAQVRKLDPKKQKVYLDAVESAAGGSVWGDNRRFKRAEAYINRLKRAGFKVGMKPGSPPPAFQD